MGKLEWKGRDRQGQERSAAGTAADKVGVLSFVVNGVGAEDVGRFLDREGIAVRVGRHCAHPTLRRFGVTSTVRPSPAFDNTHSEIDALAAAIHKASAAKGHSA